MHITLATIAAAAVTAGGGFLGFITHPFVLHKTIEEVRQEHASSTPAEVRADVRAEIKDKMEEHMASSTRPMPPPLEWREGSTTYRLGPPPPNFHASTTWQGSTTPPFPPRPPHEMMGSSTEMDDMDMATSTHPMPPRIEMHESVTASTTEPRGARAFLTRLFTFFHH